MEYVSKKKKQGNYYALPHKLMGGRIATLLKLGLRGILVCYFVKIETVFGCRINTNLLIHRDLLKHFFTTT